jgi:hypothetical protein
METKLSKDELLKQLQVIEAQEKKLKDELFYQKFSELTFIQTWKISIRWYMFIIVNVFMELAMLLNFEKTKWIMIVFPLITLLYTFSIPLEIRQKIKYMKKNKK